MRTIAVKRAPHKIAVNNIGLSATFYVTGSTHFVDGGMLRNASRLSCVPHGRIAVAHQGCQTVAIQDMDMAARVVQFDDEIC